jgi:glutamate-ammonia-ligase adenylyltransferase
MNYRSDLDLVFLYAGAGETSRGFTVQEYYTQVAQELFAYLNRMGPLGRLWESDARLRPMGSKNLLAISIEAWESYFLQGSAQTWERQASLRGRAVAGDERLAKRVDAFIRTRIPLAPDEDPALICREIHDMRRRLEASVPRGDLKRGEGGIMDVEFLVQTLQLVHGRRLPELIVPNTAAGILIALKKGLLDELAGSELLSAYQFLRWLETRFSLLLAPEESIQKLDQERLRSMIQRIGYRSSGAEAPESIFLDELRYHLARNRSHFLRILNECSAGAR